MMGYFSNATEAEIYEEQYCTKCVHYYVSEDIDPCAIMSAHFCYQEDAGDILDMLIPREGGQNGQCALFYEEVSNGHTDERRLRGLEMRRIRYPNAFLLALIRQAIEWDRAEYMRYEESRYSVGVDYAEGSDYSVITRPSGKPSIRYCGWHW